MKRINKILILLIIINCFLAVYLGYNLKKTNDEKDEALVFIIKDE